MGTRRRARESALQALYQIDMTEGSPTDPGQALDRFWHSFHPASADVREYTDQLVHGVIEHLGALDGAIAQASENWRVERMARVDRNILRIAVYEIRFLPDVPKVVAINEALEVAKRFGTEESSRFINGVLDKIEPCEKT
jgi:transcription antitermination protein NusB